jgi:hypothetical protein
VQALRDGEDGPNGVYQYGDGGFPTVGWKSANYWVDVTFVAFGDNQPPADTATTSETAPAPTESSTTTTEAPAPPPVVTPPPTAAPKPVPTTAPPVPSAVSGGPANGSNTGVPAGTVLRAAGSNTISTPGTVIEGVEWTSGCLNIEASNVTIRRSRIKTAARCGDALVQVGYDHRGLVFEDVELDGQGGAGYGICCSGFTLTRANIHGFMHGVHLNDNVVVQDSWIHDMAMKPGDHVDGIISNGDTSNIVIKHNTITNQFTQTSAIALFDDFGCFSNVTVDSNTLGGGGYTVYAGSHCNPGPAQVRWTNNRFLRTARYGPVTDVSPSVQWSNNVWNDNSQPISGN